MFTKEREINLKKYFLTLDSASEAITAVKSILWAVNFFSELSAKLIAAESSAKRLLNYFVEVFECS